MRNLGPTEFILIFLVIVLLFGAKKLPDLARSTGRSLRIFKAETKGLLDDDDDDTATKPSIEAQSSTPEATPITETQQQPESDR